MIACSPRSSVDCVCSISAREKIASAARVAKFRTHVHQFNLWQWPPVHPLVHPQQRVPSALRIRPALHAWRCRPQHHRNPQQFGPHHRHIPAMVARRLLLLVAAVVFLIHNDQAQCWQRRKHRAARAHHHPCLAAPNPVPLLGPFIRRQLRVQQRNLTAKRCMHLARHRRCKANLRHQQQRRLPMFNVCRIAATYTAVLPLPVTPYSSCGVKPPASITFLIACRAVVCAVFNVCSWAFFLPCTCRPPIRNASGTSSNNTRPTLYQRRQRAVRHGCLHQFAALVHSSAIPQLRAQFGKPQHAPSGDQLLHHTHLIRIQLGQSNILHQSRHLLQAPGIPVDCLRFAHQPALSHHAFQQSLVRSSRTAQRGHLHRRTTLQRIQHRIFAVLIFRTQLRSPRAPLRRTLMQHSSSLLAMRYSSVRLISAVSGSMPRSTSPKGAM